MDFSDVWYDESDVATLRDEAERANLLADVYQTALQEAYADTARGVLAAEDTGWVKLGVSASDLTQISLDEAKQISKKLHGYMESNPLLTRGREVRASYLFSSRYEIGTEDAQTKISPQQLNYIRKNENSVFGMEALERLESERYAAGQLFVLFDRQKKKFQHISFQEIGGIIYDPDDSSEIRYVRRDWTATLVGANGATQTTTNQVWYPASTYQPEDGFASVIDGKRVDDTKRMIVDRVNVQAGSNLGIPDSFAAAPWALAYSAYLSDGSKVLAALAEWAWLVKPKKRNPAERAAAAVRSERGAGGTLFSDMDVQSLPTKNAVDLNTGRPLAAQVASALGISIVLLLADPGQSGAYGTAQTLSDPNRRTMEARRERNTAFLVHCLELLGVKNPSVLWPKMSPGSDDEESDIVMKLWGSGLFHEDEVRGRLAELGHVTILHDKPPTGFMYPNNEKSLGRSDVDADASGEVNMQGTSNMNNGQGKDSLGIGNLSHKNQGDPERAKDKV